MLSIADVFFSRTDSTLLVTLTKPVKVFLEIIQNALLYIVAHANAAWSFAFSVNVKCSVHLLTVGLSISAADVALLNSN